MATKVNFDPERTYGTEAALDKAVGKLNLPDTIKYVVCRTEAGRLYPVFIGTKSVEYGVHFKYPVIG